MKKQGRAEDFQTVLALTYFAREIYFLSATPNFWRKGLGWGNLKEIYATLGRHKLMNYAQRT